MEDVVPYRAFHDSPDPGKTNRRDLSFTFFIWFSCLGIRNHLLFQIQIMAVIAGNGYDNNSHLGLFSGGPSSDKY